MPILCALGLGLLLAMASGGPALMAAEPVTVSARLLSDLAIYPESAAPAVVVSLNDTPLSAQVDAQVTDVPVRVGDTVKAGAVLVQLACREFELERARLQGERQATEARMELAQWQLRQTETLASQQTLPQEQVQIKRSELAALHGDVAAQAARIENTARQMGQCTVKAPFAGVVTARSVAVGQLATRGSTLVRLLDIGRSEVSAQVSNRETSALAKANALVFEHNGQRYPLRLRAILPAIHPETGTQEVRLDFGDRKAEPGAAGHLLWHDPAMHIGGDALVKRDGRPGVFIVTDKVAHFHALPDAQEGHPALIGLLPANTLIVVSGQYGLSDGMPVKVLADSEAKPIAPKAR